MLRRLALTFTLLISFFICSFSQDQEEIYKPMDAPNSEQEVVDTAKQKRNKEDKKWDWKQFRVGGNFGMQFGNVTYVDISPTFGYYVIPEKLQVGIGTLFITISVVVRITIQILA